MGDALIVTLVFFCLPIRQTVLFGGSEHLSECLTAGVIIYSGTSVIVLMSWNKTVRMLCLEVGIRSKQNQPSFHI